MSDVLDLVIIGAGLSGIGAACRYVTEFPDGQFEKRATPLAGRGTYFVIRAFGLTRTCSPSAMISVRGKARKR
jgi:hypothetical protein